MRFSHAYFCNGTAYARKSTMVKRLAQKHHGIACEENYHDSLLAGLRKDEFPCLTYTRDLQDWRDFIRRSPEEYEAWIDGCTRGCTMFELQILEIADRDHVVILLADPEVSVNRFFDRPDSFCTSSSCRRTTPKSGGRDAFDRRKILQSCVNRKKTWEVSHGQENRRGGLRPGSRPHGLPAGAVPGV